jgi:hypothetical protein
MLDVLGTIELFLIADSITFGRHLYCCWCLSSYLVVCCGGSLSHCLRKARNFKPHVPWRYVQPPRVAAGEVNTLLQLHALSKPPRCMCSEYTLAAGETT